MERPDQGFSVLLKPLNENFLSDWEVPLGKYLDEFVDTVHESDSTVNFVHAALILQNSVRVYSKRVDIVHQSIVDFANACCAKNDKKTGKNGKGSKKRNVHSLQAETFDLLDMPVTKGKIDEEELEKDTNDIKPLRLDLTAGASVKRSVQLKVYKDKDEILGDKSEFRLYWWVYEDGSLNKDCNIGSEPAVEAEPDNVPPWDEEMLDVSVDSCRDVVEPEPMDIDVDPDVAEEPHSGTFQVEEPSRAPTPEFEAHSVAQAAASHKGLHPPRRKKMMNDDSWKKTTAKVYPKKLKMKKNDKLPKYLDEDKENIPQVSVLWVKLLGQQNNVATREYLSKKKQKSRKEWRKLHEQPLTQVNEDVTVNELFDAIDNDDDDDDIPINDGFDGNDDLDGNFGDEPIVNQLGDVDFQTIVQNTIDNQLLERFNQAKKQEAQNMTELAERVAKWHESIAPALQIAKERRDFDIHSYGSVILGNLEENSDHVDFAKVIPSCEREEVCRFFLSSLMLANTENVEIKRTKGLVKDELELRLLSRVRHHEEMNENLRGTSN